MEIKSGKNGDIVCAISDMHYATNFKDLEDAMKRISNIMGLPNYNYPKIDKIIYNMKNPDKPATIVYWTDFTKTVVMCNDKDTFTKEMGVAMCFIRKMMPNRSEFLRLVESGYVQE